VIQSESGDYKVQIRGYAHFDGRFYPGDEARTGTDTFLLRRVRPILQGSVGRHFDFNLTPDFGGGTTVLQDAYLDFKPSPALRVRAGKFKSPVGLERLQSATAIHFIERAFPTSILPNRDVGLQAFGELFGGVVAYAGAVLDGTSDGSSLDTDTNDGKDLAGRLFLSPFRKGSGPLKSVGFGIAGTTGTQTGAAPSYRSGGQLTIFSYATGVTLDGSRTRVSPQLSFYSGPFGLLAEYARSESRVVKATAPTSAEIQVTGWQATASVALTGDAASFSGIRPRKSYDPAKGQWGALELVARVNGFEVEDEAFAGGFADPARSVRKATAWGLGLNWHLTRNVKQAATYERTSFTGGAAGGADRPSENALFVRTQVSF
jgi:phosphate-selective porin OprO/OprP